jgi:hypothetical protein
MRRTDKTIIDRNGRVFMPSERINWAVLYVEELQCIRPGNVFAARVPRRYSNKSSPHV